MIDLRWYQDEAVSATFDFLRTNKEDEGVIVAPTGAGKSIIISAINTQLLTKWEHLRVIVCSHVAELVEQDYKAQMRYWKRSPAGIYSAGLGKRDTRSPIVFATIQSVVNKAHVLGHRDLMIIDECFTGDTLVNTETGKKRIDKVRLGDIVNNAIGIGEVIAISRKKTDLLLTIRLSNGKTIKCTREHLFFTRNGWIEAYKLDKGVELVCLQSMPELWDSFHPMEEQSKKKKQNGDCSAANKWICENKILLNILLKEARKCYVGYWSKRKNDCNIERNWSQTENTWREWKEKHRSSRKTFKCIREWMASRVSNKNMCWTLKWYLSKLLQSGLGESIGENSNRNRWFFPQWEEKRTGQKERCEASSVRVESITVEKQRSGKYVYNLQVSGHPSYFVDDVLVHNCHLLSHKDDGVYKRFIAAMREINPKMRVLGLTATPYRLDVGMITEGEGRIFSKIIYEIPVKTLVDEGSLTPLTSSCTKALQLETEGVRITGGEFNTDDMAEKYEELIEPICDDIAVKAAHRKSILVFVPRVDIAKKFVDALNNRGMYAESLDGSAKKPERKSIIERFKDGDIRVLVSVNILTTGFDAPNVDCVVLARATVSAGLYYQIVGRGMRLDKNKPDCLVLDYGGNIRRHGAVTNIKPPRNKTAWDVKREEKEEEDEARTKTCEACGFVHTPVYPDDCLHCGKPLPKASSDPKADNYKSKADNIDPMHGEVKVAPPAQWMSVNSWEAKVHQKHGKTPTLQVTYHTDFLSINEWVCFEHIGFAGQKARAWYRKMRDNALQDSEASFGGQLTCKDALEYDFSHLRCPDEIKVKEDGKWHLILDYRFNQVIAQESEYDPLDDIVF